MMSSVQTRRRRATVRRRRHTEEVLSLSDSDNDCIVLDEGSAPPIVDLTSTPTTQRGEQGVNDASVVVIGTPDGSPPRRRQRRQLSAIHIDDDVEVVPQVVQVAQVDSDDEIPECPFYVPPRQPDVSTRASTAAVSPEPISCPICLDDYKTIKRNNRKLYSTLCGHVFCNQCIESSIRQHHCCPLCRKRLTIRNIIPLHI